MPSLHLLPFLVAFTLLASPAVLSAAPGLEGRWEGVVEVPGVPQPLVVDLAPAPDGAWIGSLILPGRGVKGAPLAELDVGADTLSFSLASAMPFPVEPAPRLDARLDAGGELRGGFHLEGLVAPVVLRRSGPAQPDRPPASTPVAAALTGEWNGGYELLGQPRTVSLHLAGTTATMRIVGRRTTDIAFALVRQKGGFLSLAGNAWDIGFEGNWDEDKGFIDGTFMQGPIELPLQLRRVGKED